jgi:hypothetical protein
MRVLEGTPEELYQYEQLKAERQSEPAAAEDPIIPFISERFRGDAAGFAKKYAQGLVEIGLKPEIGAQGRDPRGRYLAVRAANGRRIAYIHRARVEFALDHDDVADLDRQVERKSVQSEFRVGLRRQTPGDVQLALELTRRAADKAKPLA